MSGAKQTIVLCITPLQYKVCGDQQGNTTLCLGQAQPRGLIWVPRNWGHCFENGSLFLPHLRINQSNCFAVYKEKLHLSFPLLHALSTGLVRNVGSWGSFVTANTHWYTKAWAWKSSSLLLFSKDSNVCDSTRTWERRSNRPYSSSHHATKTQLWKEGGWERLTGQGPRAGHPPPLLQLCKEWKRHGNKSQSIKFIEGN